MGCLNTTFACSLTNRIDSDDNSAIDEHRFFCLLDDVESILVDVAVVEVDCDGVSDTLFNDSCSVHVHVERVLVRYGLPVD